MLVTPNWGKWYGLVTVATVKSFLFSTSFPCEGFLPNSFLPGIKIPDAKERSYLKHCVPPVRNPIIYGHRSYFSFKPVCEWPKCSFLPSLTAFFLSPAFTDLTIPLILQDEAIEFMMIMLNLVIVQGRLRTPDLSFLGFASFIFYLLVPRTLADAMCFFNLKVFILIILNQILSISLSNVFNSTFINWFY